MTKKPMRLALSCCPAVALTLTLLGGCAPGSEPDSETASEWTQFRGPGGLGVSSEVNLPRRWRSTGKTLRWKTRIPGQGDSSPIISRGKVFLTTAYQSPEDTREVTKTKAYLQRVVMALDLETGEILWQKSLYTGATGAIHWLNGHATPTPVADGERVFASFDGRIAALDYDGNLLWEKDLEPDYVEYAEYGTASSPIVNDKAVFVFQDREGGESADAGWLVALDKKTGDELWRDEWRNTCCSYTTPVLLEKNGREILLTSTSHEANAYNPDTGERLWQVNHRNIQPVPSISVLDEYLTFPGAIHDALLSTFLLSELDVEPEPLWSTTKAVPDMPSPIHYEGKLFTLDSGGIMVARDPATGQNIWRARLPGSNYRAALVAGDGKVYAVNDLGNTAVIDALAGRFKLLKENELGEGSGATPAIADGALFIRGADHLFCIETVEEEEEDEADDTAAETPTAG